MKTVSKNSCLTRHSFLAKADNIKIKRKASLFPVTQTHKELELRPKPQLEVSLHRETNEQL